MNSTGTDPRPIPVEAGIGLRAPHCEEILSTHPSIAWLEVHSENYFAPGGTAVTQLERIRQDYPLSLHGVGLSLGSTDPLDPRHLQNLRTAVERYAPALVSEHLSWGSVGGECFNDLLPLPYTEEALVHVSARIAEVQEYLGRQILIENVSCYLEFEHSMMPEWEFLREVAMRSDCGILLDVNNVYVNAVNHGFDPYGYIGAIPAERVYEIHLAGHTAKRLDGVDLLIDSHDQRVAEAVWQLYAHTLTTLGRKPTLLEWDSNLPALSVLLEEAAKAQHLMEKTRVAAA